MVPRKQENALPEVLLGSGLGRFRTSQLTERRLSVPTITADHIKQAWGTDPDNRL